MSHEKKNSSAAEVHEMFEWAGSPRIRGGTSYRSGISVETVSGRPLRHDLIVAGRQVLTSGTSGASTLPTLTASGRPTRHGLSASAPRATPEAGSGHAEAGLRTSVPLRIS
jgi:hypothetical protein